MSQGNFDELRTAFTELTDQHGWRPLQTPRNMTMALTGHVGAVAARLQFASDDADVEEIAAAVRSDLGSCLVYLLTLGDALGIDPTAAALADVRVALASSPPKPD